MKPSKMTPSKIEPADRDQMLDELIDGSISEADFLRIEAEMIVDAEVRQAFYRRVELDVMLDQESKSEAEPAAIDVASAPAVTWTVKRLLASFALAAGVLVAFGLVWQYASSTSQTISLTASDEEDSFRPSPMREFSATGFAVLMSQSECVWSDAAILPGKLLPIGDLHLQSGLALIEFFSGAQMVIEGDAKFSIDSAMQVTMTSGRVRARVPEPAKGFLVKTISGDIVDLGTEFTVDVSADTSDVHVIDGEVELHSTGRDIRRVFGGEGYRIGGDAGGSTLAMTDAGLISPADFYARSDDRLQARFDQWLASSSDLRSDERLIAFFGFDENEIKRRKLFNARTSSNDGATRIADGTIVAADATADRWGRVGEALDFSRVGSRVRVNVPGQYRGLTLNCWVKINGLDRWYNSLFLTDGHEDREPHWQLIDDGRIFFSVKVPSRDESQTARQHVFYSPTVWDPSLSGRWMMLSVTYDVDRKQVTHFVNGSAISVEAIPDFALVESVQLGDASIGNWNEPMYRSDASFAVRNLNGCMDEFSIHTGTLNEQEILSIYRKGNPNAN